MEAMESSGGATVIFSLFSGNVEFFFVSGFIFNAKHTRPVLLTQVPTQSNPGVPRCSYPMNKAVKSITAANTATGRRSHLPPPPSPSVTLRKLPPLTWPLSNPGTSSAQSTIALVAFCCCCSRCCRCCCCCCCGCVGCVRGCGRVSCWGDSNLTMFAPTGMPSYFFRRLIDARDNSRLSMVEILRSGSAIGKNSRPGDMESVDMKFVHLVQPIMSEERRPADT